MTDEELCKALRWKAGVYAKRAADRIEALVKRMQHQRREADRAIHELAARAEAAETALKEAVDMMNSLIAMVQHAIGPGKDVFIEPDTGRKLSDARAVIDKHGSQK